MKQIIIQLETPEIQALEKAGDKIAIAKVKRIFISILSSCEYMVCICNIELKFLSSNTQCMLAYFDF